VHWILERVIFKGVVQLAEWLENSGQVWIRMVWILVVCIKLFIFFFLLFVYGKQFEQGLRILLLQEFFYVAENRFKTAG
jgi:hypothetical protein